MEVSMSGSGATSHLLTRVEVLPGKQTLVSVIGTFTDVQGSNRRPDFHIGDTVSYGPTEANVHASASAILTESADVSVRTVSGYGTSTFEGTVYTTEI